MADTTTFIGIDVSKNFLDVHVLPQGTHWRCEQSNADHAQLVQRLLALKPTLIVLEATGGLELRASRTRRFNYSGNFCGELLPTQSNSSKRFHNGSACGCKRRRCVRRHVSWR